MQIFYELSSINDSFIPELIQHLRHVDANLLRIIVQTGTDEAEAIRCQYPAMQLVVLVLLIFLILLIRYLLHYGKFSIKPCPLLSEILLTALTVHPGYSKFSRHLTACGFPYKHKILPESDRKEEH